MKQRYFDELSRCLKQRGIAPGLARRLVMELGEHADDAAEELREQGISEDEAYRRVLERFGAPKEFARALAADYQRRSFSGRHPLLSFGLGPVAAMVALLIAPIVLGSLLGPDTAAAPLPWTDIPIQRAYAFAATFLNVVTPFIASIYFAIIGTKGRHHPLWTGLSCGLLSLIGLLLNVNIAYSPSPDLLHSSAYSLGLGLSSHIPSVNLIAALLPLCVFFLYAFHKKFVEK